MLNFKFFIGKFIACFRGNSINCQINIKNALKLSELDLPNKETALTFL